MPFTSIYRHGFVRVALGVPFVRLGSPGWNARRTIELARRADAARAALVLFPELGLTGYSNEDLFHQDALLGAAEEALAEVVEASRALNPLLLVGAPLRVEQKLFNCAVALPFVFVVPWGYVASTFLGNREPFRAATIAQGLGSP